MANSPQARKRARQAAAHRACNVGRASRYRTSVKKVAKLIAAGDREGALQSFKAAIPLIDSAVTDGLIHRNKAARQKSRLNARIKSL